MTNAAAVYLRISEDRPGQALGVARQRADCLALAERKGWPVAAEYVDNDLTASKARVRRPAYQQLLADLRAGTVDAVVVWHLDRLHRRPIELEEFIGLADDKGVALATVTGDVDLGTSSGRLHARIMGAVARHETELKSDRQRSKSAELAKAGKVSGGGYRPFGFEPDRITIRETEAEIVRELARRTLAGESWRSLIEDLESRGVTPTGGKKWSAVALRRMLLSPRIAGLRQHGYENPTSHSGPIVAAKAVWDPIVDEVTFRRLTTMLRARERSSTRLGRYLLTGLAVCGLCGANLLAGRRDDGKRRYRCVPSRHHFSVGGCGKIVVQADPLEEFVAGVVLTALADPAHGPRLRAREGDADRLAGLLRVEEDALEQLARDHYADRVISRPEYLAARGRILGRADDLRRALTAAAAPTVLHGLPDGFDALEALWERSGEEWHRTVLTAALERVEVGPAVRGRNFFDAGRVTPRWRA